MQHRHWSLPGLGALLCSAGIVSAGIAGCSGEDVSRLELSNSPVAQTGQLELALTAHGASGALYRLRQAQFQAFSTDPFGGGSFAFLSSENDPLATSLEATLDIGNYVISLFGGWFLEKVQDGQVTRVQARLVSSESQEFSISANEETVVQYRFETNGEIIEFGQGRLIVEIEVAEQNSEPEPEFTLGDPLEIVDGVISPDSNPHGISAALIALPAPIGASIEVTSDTGEVCVRGSIAPVENEDFATQWGALVGFDFLNAAGDEAQPFGLDGGRVAGFAFTVTGPDLPFMRLQALPGGADPTLVNFCRGFSALSGDSFEMPLESLDLSCWENTPNPLVTMSLANISWLMVSDIGIGHTFDVCFSDLRPLLR